MKQAKQMQKYTVVLGGQWKGKYWIGLGLSLLILPLQLLFVMFSTCLVDFVTCNIGFVTYQILS